MTKAKFIIALRSIAEVGVAMSFSRFYKRTNASRSYAYSMANLHRFRAVSAINYQTVCNDLCLGSVQTNNSFYLRHNTANVRTLQLVTQMLTANKHFGSFCVIEYPAL